MRVRIVCSLTTLVLAANANAQSLSQRADSVMRAAERDGFSGVVRVEKNGSVVLERGYGLAIRPATRFTPATVVQIGSNTKDFTAVAILQLQERGALNVRDSLGKFFPSAPADKKRITLFQLMKHRAGFPLGLGGDFEKVSREQLISNAMAFKLLFKPGEKEAYSNTGYSILAAVIEKVSGKTYDVYVRDNILKPLGMMRTGYLLPGFKPRDVANGYLANGSDAGNIVWKPHAADGPYWNLRGNGGMVSTVNDMHTFYKALFESSKLLQAKTREIMFRPDEPVGLAGSDLVNFFLYERDPMSKTEMIIASNRADRKAPSVRRGLATVVGLPTDVGQGDGGTPLKPNGKPPAAGAAAVINGLIAAMNSGNDKTLLAFITDHFDNTPSSPKPEERVGRIGGVHGNVGNMTVTGMYDSGDGPIQVTIKTENQGPGTLIVDVERGEPYKIKRLGLQIGN
ncbi:MAG: serine hydrolase [Gemmatimonadales bacterium]